MKPPAGGTRILVGVATLFSDGAAVPRPLADARIALERLAWLGEPVVLVGEELAGRRLPEAVPDRLAWVAAGLDVPGLALVAFDEAGAPRAGDAADLQATGRWAELRAAWAADTLITAQESSVGAARRAGLAVVRIGPRGPGADPTLPRADHEAIDLLDAVRRLIVADTFGEQDRDEPREEPALVSGVRGPAGAGGSDVLHRGQPRDG